MTRTEALERVAAAARAVCLAYDKPKLAERTVTLMAALAALDALDALPPAAPAPAPEPVGKVVEVAVNVRLSNDRSAYIASGMGSLNGDWAEPRMGSTIATIRARVPLPVVPEVVGEVEP